MNRRPHSAVPHSATMPVFRHRSTRPAPLTVAALAIVGLATLASGPALADSSFSTYGSNVNGKVFNRPGAGNGTGVRYVAQHFQVPDDAFCSIRSTQSYDGYLLLYAGDFNPQNPTANLVASSDDGDYGPGTSAIASRLFQDTPQEYVLVTTAYRADSEATGTFHNTIECAGDFVESTGPGACRGLFAPDTQHACLAGGRFYVQVNWTLPSGQTGTGKLVPMGSDESAIISFFSPANFEMLVKVLNGCPVNNKWWIFSAATTNVQYTLTVVDTVSGATYTFNNAQGQIQPAKLDTAALPCP